MELDFKNVSEVISRLTEIIEYTEVNDGFMVNKIWSSISPILAELCVESKRYCDLFGNNDIEQCIIELTSMSDDLCSLGSAVRLKLIPMIEIFIRTYWQLDITSSDTRYNLFLSECGAVTIRDNLRKLLLHSSSDPYTEARHLAQILYKPEYEKAIILGCGLGYLASELYRLSDGLLDIVIYEDDCQIIEYAFNYGTLSDIPENKLIVLQGENEDETIEAFLAEISKSEKKCKLEYAYWWYPVSANEENKKLISEYNLDVCSSVRQKVAIERNVWNNIRNVDSYASELESTIKNGDAIVIAAGPSLDESISKIKVWGQNKTIIAVVTVLKKLLEADIVPDYVVAIDAMSEEYAYVSGIEYLKVPLIMAPSLYWKYSTNYQGKKYLIPIPSTEAMGIKLYRDRIKQWNGGSSVLLFAVEAAIIMGCSSIYLIGADLSFPDGYSHALGTQYRRRIDCDSEPGYFCTPSVDGREVLTSYAMGVFKTQLENLIKNTVGVTFFNTSPNGAYIEGTIPYYLKND